MKLRQTPWQTVGPFFGPALVVPGMEVLRRAETQGEPIVIEGRILDGDRAPVTDALIEVWQANGAGRYDHPEDWQKNKLLDPAFHGFGRAETDAEGRFRFETVRPGPVSRLDGRLQAPHINVSLLARGLLRRLVTRIYFPEDALNADDPVLNLVPEARRGSLIARKVDKTVFNFDILLQGSDETVFLDI